MKLNHWWEPADANPNAESVVRTVMTVLLTSFGIFLICSALWLILIAWLIENEANRSGLLGTIGTFQNPNYLFIVQWALLVTFGVVEMALILAIAGLRQIGKGIVAAGLAIVLSLSAIWSVSVQQFLPAVVFANVLQGHDAIYVTASIQACAGLFLVFGNGLFSQLISSRFFTATTPKGEPIHS